MHTHTHTHRLTVLPGLQRLYQETATFEASALSDLTISMQTLERARTDYRAALLWMKDVSGKLHNPDYRDQLVRFREVSCTPLCVCMTHITTTYCVCSLAPPKRHVHLWHTIPL